ncbi:transcriptional regulator with XRE-family HTH domain [Streptomyces sp. PvR006]|uniref:transcriptional regulator n=1 Tax=Streptomyces sp. PvR006 TaxID=2817860 RepID=UPI0027DD5197|nr:transcriptional regulator [Streptomyces sp. PvR006]MBP2583346.1 transcriptional regulator with XRE-family HTH domain [Streptomyces sp. PvR006]
MNTVQNHPGETPAEDPAPEGEDLAALLLRLLGETRRTQKELATATGIAYPTLNAWARRTRGTSQISPDDLRAITNVVRSWGGDVSVRQVFEAAGRPIPGPTDQEREARLLAIYRALPVDSQRALIQTAEAMRKASRAA